MKRIISLLIMVLVTNMATAQITPAQLRKSLDSVANLSRVADAAQNTLIGLVRWQASRDSIQLAAIPRARQSTIDSLLRINQLLSGINRRLDSVNRTVAANIATDSAQATKMIALSNQLAEHGISIQDVLDLALTAKYRVFLAEQQIEAIKQYFKAIP